MKADYKDINDLVRVVSKYYNGEESFEYNSKYISSVESKNNNFGAYIVYPNLSAVENAERIEYFFEKIYKNIKKSKTCMGMVESINAIKRQIIGCAVLGSFDYMKSGLSTRELNRIKKSIDISEIQCVDFILDSMLKETNVILATKDTAHLYNKVYFVFDTNHNIFQHAEAGQYLVKEPDANSAVTQHHVKNYLEFEMELCSLFYLESIFSNLANVLYINDYSYRYSDIPQLDRIIHDISYEIKGYMGSIMKYGLILAEDRAREIYLEYHKHY